MLLDKMVRTSRRTGEGMGEGMGEGKVVGKVVGRVEGVVVGARRGAQRCERGGFSVLDRVASMEVGRVVEEQEPSCGHGCAKG